MLTQNESHRHEIEFNLAPHPSFTEPHGKKEEMVRGSDRDVINRQTKLQKAPTGVSRPALTGY